MARKQIQRIKARRNARRLDRQLKQLRNDVILQDPSLGPIGRYFTAGSRVTVNNDVIVYVAPVWVIPVVATPVGVLTHSAENALVATVLMVLGVLWYIRPPLLRRRRVKVAFAHFDAMYAEARGRAEAAVLSASRSHGLLDPVEVADAALAELWPLAQEFSVLEQGTTEQQRYDLTQQAADRMSRLRTLLDASQEVERAAAERVRLTGDPEQEISPIEALAQHARALADGTRALNWQMAEADRKRDPEAVMAAIAAR